MDFNEVGITPYHRINVTHARHYSPLAFPRTNDGHIVLTQVHIGFKKVVISLEVPPRKGFSHKEVKLERICTLPRTLKFDVLIGEHGTLFKVARRHETLRERLAVNVFATRGKTDIISEAYFYDTNLTDKLGKFIGEQARAVIRAILPAV